MDNSRGKKDIPIIAIVFSVACFGLAGWLFMKTQAVVDGRSNANRGTACTADAKLCPDGSAVGRQGPNCIFALCPGESDIDSFVECEAAGYPVMESYPRQCAANRQSFTENFGNANRNGSATPVERDGCVVTGCSGQVCAGEDVVTDCAYREEYSCYASESAVCERQSNGKCGWTLTDALQQCINQSGGEVLGAEFQNGMTDEISSF